MNIRRRLAAFVLAASLLVAAAPAATPAVHHAASAAPAKVTPYKSRYSLGEFWAALTQGTIYKAYAKANPGEAARIAAVVEKKIAEQAYTLPLDTAKTHTGKAIVMVLCTLSGGPPTP